MHRIQMAMTMALGVGLATLPGCCMKKINLKPVAQFTSTGIGTASIESEYEFADCLSCVERAIVEDAKRELLEALKDVRQNRITQEDFDQFVSNTARALELLQRRVSDSVEGGAGFTAGSREEAAAQLLTAISRRPR